MNFKELLNNDEIILLDGAMGTMLLANGLPIAENPSVWGHKNRDVLCKIHQEYLDAGAKIICTNTFSANRDKLENTGYSVEEIIKSAVDTAKSATNGNAIVALDIGPIGRLLEPVGSLSFEDAYEIFKEQIIAGKDADVIFLETFTDLYEAKAALLAAKENCNLPVVCSMSFEKNGRTFTGCTVSAMALTLGGLGADAIGINCSLGPDDLFNTIEELSKWTNLPLFVKPNAGLPDPQTKEYDVLPNEFAESMKKLLPFGIKLAGGCCGTTPEYIEKLNKILQSQKFNPLQNVIPSAVCSASKTVVINEPRIIGERINPTGKPLLKEALKSDNLNYLLAQAIEQIESHADILDVNVGLPGIDEEAIMMKAVKSIQGVVDAPLQIDSPNSNVIEAALRVYNGKPIINSVNGDEESMTKILPLAKKYGAAVIGLTLDQNGIPRTAEDRLNIAKKIVQRAESYGIPSSDIYIDCLTLAASAEQDVVLETLKAVSLVKKELGVKTVLGVSNISFGLPNRELINETFLTMALSHGLDLPIMNPNNMGMAGAFDSFKMLLNIDKQASTYIARHNGQKAAEPTKAETKNILYAIHKGLKADARILTEELLKTENPMEIINEKLIPALDDVGTKFERGEIFLPQLMASAEAAQEAFAVIRSKLSQEQNEQKSFGTIVLATVKGDIHDIGKNIVKVLLQNYGYDVIDLGRDVPPKTVVQAAKEHEAKLVGLSALMTTTLDAMEETIKLLHIEIPNCKVMVGGAVLTEDYALKIGADFYSKDAKMGIDIAKKVFNNN